MKPHTPDWLVERLHRGDLPPDEAGELRARLAAEGGLERLDDLAREDAEILRAYPPGPALSEIRRRGGVAAPRRAHLRRLFLAAVPVAAAAAVVFLRLHPASHVDDGMRSKGLKPHLVVHRQGTAAQAEALTPNSPVRTGDVLQLSYVAAGRSYGFVLSVDGRGVVTRHGPGDGPAAARLGGGGAVPLANAYQLDDAPSFERFFIVTSDLPFAIEPVVEAVRRLAADGRGRDGTPELPADLSSSDFTVEKAP